jgi:hypothetical protein
LNGMDSPIEGEHAGLPCHNWTSYER